MGSNTGSVGNLAGKALWTIPAASTDSGVLISTVPYVDANSAQRFGELVTGWSKFLFQLIVGDATAGSVTVYGTIDAATATGINDNWEIVPAPSTEAAQQWANPLQVAAGGRLLYTNAPFCAFKAVSSEDYDGTTAQLLILATQ